MYDTQAYEAHIAKSKAPKSWSKVRRILQYIILGVRNGYSTAVMADKLNAKQIMPLIAPSWNCNNLQMSIMFVARLDETSSLGRGFAWMLKNGEATPNDYALFQDRVRA